MPQFPYVFCDRDGTIIDEPLPSRQIDSLEKLRFLPGAIGALSRLQQKTAFRWVMVTNQDGLGTESFPEETFWPAHNRMLETLAGEGVSFDEVWIDRSFAHENKPTRKPGLGLFAELLAQDGLEKSSSWVIGDRATDALLGFNLGIKTILIRNEENGPSLDEYLGSLTPQQRSQVQVVGHWTEIELILQAGARQAEVIRQTHETNIRIRVNLDSQGPSTLRTGVGFFDHMLEQITRHAGIELHIEVQGDLHVDEHHTIEDTGLALGEALKLALGDKKGISRYGFLLPMDEALAQVALDFSGRPWLVWKAEFRREKIGDMPTEMFYHFFKSLCDTAGLTLNIQVEGDNEHHKIEAIFKAFAKALKMALARNRENLDQIPSTKGTLAG